MHGRAFELCALRCMGTNNPHLLCFHKPVPLTGALESSRKVCLQTKFSLFAVQTVQTKPKGFNFSRKCDPNWVPKIETDSVFTSSRNSIIFLMKRVASIFFDNTPWRGWNSRKMVEREQCSILDFFFGRARRSRGGLMELCLRRRGGPPPTPSLADPPYHHHHPWWSRDGW